jgi:ribonucleoside-diphosphate reductase alpha chain
MCHIADAVLSGGIRRAALISLFSEDDMDMLSCKAGAWWELNPQRGRANNSVTLKRGTVDKEEFKDIWQRVKDSGSGEPGIFWTNDYDVGTNPCAEISLKSMQFCNLTEVNVDDVESQEDLDARVKAAAFIGTIQAGYTDFHYLRTQWKENTEKDALIGVGMTGIGSGKVEKLDLVRAAYVVNEENARVAALIGINPSARTTTVKPSGTSSTVVGSASGIHAWHNDYYIRRVRVGKNEALYSYMVQNFPSLIEDCKFKPHLESVMSFPQKAPEGSILRTEPAMDLLERVKRFNQEWVFNGYRSGANNHNVSCTISLKEEEWETVGEWMWENKEFYTGISVLPYDGGTYVQAPFTDCTKEEYDSLIKFCHDIDLTQVIELGDNTALNEQAACGAGGCAV